MSTFGITGATGHLGRLTIEKLLTDGVEPRAVVALVRDPARAADLSARGVQVRPADYNRPETWAPALAGVENLLLISGNELGQRIAQHQAVVDAAVAVGVGRIAYTSLLRADRTELILGPEHRATEELIRASGLPFTFLRNGWYNENYLVGLPQYLEHGVILGATHGGTISAAARADYAAAAVAVLSQDGHEGAVYELAGEDFTLASLAETITAVSGKQVVSQDVSESELITALQAAGLDAGTTNFLAALDAGVARGELVASSDTLVKLIGRPTTPMADSVRAALRSDR